MEPCQGCPQGRGRTITHQLRATSSLLARGSKLAALLLFILQSDF